MYLMATLGQGHEMIDNMRLRDCLRVPQEPGTRPFDLRNGYSNTCMYVWRCQDNYV